MRFHVPSLPHTNTTDEYSWCAYTTKVKRFCTMMSSLGHEVYLYGGVENEAKVTEFITVATPPENKHFIAPFNRNFPMWADMNARVIPEIRKRARKGDILAIIGGMTQQPISEAIPELRSVEFGIGYSGIYSDFRVFESYAWMQSVLSQTKDAASAIGQFYDRVIPNYFDVDEFPEGDGKGDYLFFIGRLIPLKGLKVVDEIQQRTGLPLIVAGTGDESLLPKSCEYVGNVLPGERSRLMGGARAVLVPTLYAEPFGGVNVEAQLTGTPVITTDWGAFTETVVQGVTGWRCHDLGEFCWAAENIGELDRTVVREHAMRYDMNRVKYEYEDYFNQVTRLDDGGWYNDERRKPMVP